MQPAWEAFKSEHSGEFIFQEIDIESNPQTRLDFEVRSIPAFILVENGKVVKRTQGAHTQTELNNWVFDEQGSV